MKIASLCLNEKIDVYNVKVRGVYIVSVKRCK